VRHGGGGGDSVFLGHTTIHMLYMGPHGKLHLLFEVAACKGRQAQGRYWNPRGGLL
jgi:hypothetical protein